MTDQIIDAAMARSLHADAHRTRSIVAWVVERDPPHYPDKVIACLIADVATLYVLLGDTVAEVHAALPVGLKRSGCQLVDAPDVVEIWFTQS